MSSFILLMLERGTESSEGYDKGEILLLSHCSCFPFRCFVREQNVLITHLFLMDHKISHKTILKLVGSSFAL